jgi:DNA repair protein RAD57
LLLSVQLPKPHGVAKSAIYISTEAPLSTYRLTQLLNTHPRLSLIPEPERPSLSRVHAIQTLDLEAQEQIIRYQVPVAIQQWNIGLVVIDSIASNYRAEFDDLPGSNAIPRNGNHKASNVRAMGERMRLLTQLGSFLRDLARRENIAIVVSNQVSDRFDSVSPLQPNELPGGGTSVDPLSLDHQQRWITGWGDIAVDPSVSLPKTPALGLVWTNQIAARIALIKEANVQERRRRRWMRVVFATWTAQTKGMGVEYEITPHGVAAVRKNDSQSGDS